ncbi:sugar ABC transporter ATP-binding protein [Microvirga antarctica]|uniref:sugar ABC transporter ATP-binding protein n=1 Tax=Microvirga antarctica TaxID=2819233 RepID=UPI001B311ACC|nr:sugar ABC transporter ATP-binding protein [Microvirga antarctica]
MTAPPLLTMTGIAKHYGATCALRDASLRLYPGRVHALLGENGAGKSTLVKMIVGVVRPDGGTITFGDAAVAFRTVRDAVAAGIIPIYQHLSLFPQLTILENLSAFAFGATRDLRASSATLSIEQARAWLSSVGLERDPMTLVEEISIGERQLVEIARGLGQACKVLILDEPTAALTQDETERLFTVVRSLCAQGTAVLFISHKFDEIDSIADDVTILRDGRTVVDGAPIRSLTRDELVRAMLGEAVATGSRELPPPGDVLVEARGLRLHATAEPIDMGIRAGEIVGLAGLVGSGALDIASALAGATPVASGTLLVAGDVIPFGDRHTASKKGIGYVPSDRHLQGLFPVLTAMQNASASSLKVISRRGVVREQAESDRLLPWLRRLKLHPLKTELPAASFSGGNQQKLLMARNLALPGLRVLVVLEPTRGVDIAARETIHQAIIEAALKGVAVLLASSDLDEIEALSHRILVVRQGRISQELPRGTARGALVSALAERDAA